MKKFVAILSAMMFAILAILPMTGAMAETVTNSTEITEATDVSSLQSANQLYVSSDNGKGVNLRASASTSAKVLAKLGEGKPVTRMATVNDTWTKIKVRIDGKDVVGYAMTKYLDAVDPCCYAQVFHNVSHYNVTVTPSNGSNGHVNLRAEANVKSTCRQYLHKGDALTVLAESECWYKVRTANGVTGYVVKAFVAKA